MAGILKKLAGETAIYGISSIVGRLINFLLVPVYTKVLLPADYGIVSELYAYVAFLLVFLSFGMETTYFNFLQNSKNKAHTYDQSLLILFIINGLALVFGIVFLSPIAEFMLFQDTMEFVAILLFVVIIDVLCTLPLARLRAENKAKKFAFIQITSILVNVILNIVLMLFVFDPEVDEPYWGILYILIANLVASLVKTFMLRSFFIPESWYLDRETIQNMLRYAFPIALAGLAFVVNETLDRVLMKQILNHETYVPSDFEGSPLRYAETQVGIYSANYKLTMFIALFLQAFRYAAEPFFFANAKNDPERKVYGRIMNAFVAVLCLGFLIVSLNIDLFKYFISNEAYHVGLHVVPVLLIANIFLGVYANQSIWYKLSGQTKFGAYISMSGAVITITLLYSLIPFYGYTGAAWTTLVVYGLQMVASYLLSQKYYPIHYNLRKIGLYFGLALFIFALCSFVQIENMILRLLFNNTLIVLFLGIIWSFERKALKKI
jgi:O-antigen/teichoic acid export membrane protein